MHIVAISGSLRPSSVNTAIVRACAKLVGPDVTFTLFENMSDLPHFSPDRDGENLAPAVTQWRALVQAADGVIISTPEYAYGMPGSLKNALDWNVPSGEFYEKPVAAISASPSASGGERALTWLIQTLTAQHALINESATLAVGFAREKMDATGEVTDSTTLQNLQNVLDSLMHTIEKNQKSSV